MGPLIGGGAMPLQTQQLQSKQQRTNRRVDPLGTLAASQASCTVARQGLICRTSSNGASDRTHFSS